MFTLRRLHQQLFGRETDYISNISRINSFVIPADSDSKSVQKLEYRGDDGVILTLFLRLVEVESAIRDLRDTVATLTRSTEALSQRLHKLSDKIDPPTGSSLIINS